MTRVSQFTRGGLRPGRWGGRTTCATLIQYSLWQMGNVPTDGEIGELGATSLGRDEGTSLPRDATVRTAKWRLQFRWCNDNVRDWVGQNPNHKQVYGFCYLEFAGRMPFVRFSAHSVEAESW